MRSLKSRATTDHFGGNISYFPPRMVLLWGKGNGMSTLPRAGPLFLQETPTLATRSINATTSPHVLNQWYKSQRCSWSRQSCGKDSGVHFAIRLFIGTGPTNENTTART